MPKQQNLKDVIREANNKASEKGTAVGVGWDRDKGEWFIYNLEDGLSGNQESELICFARGVMPIATTKTALEALTCAIGEVLIDWDRKTDLTKEHVCQLNGSI